MRNYRRHRAVLDAIDSLVVLTQMPMMRHFPRLRLVTGYGAPLWAVPSFLDTFSNYVLDHRLCLAPMRWKVRQWPYWIGYHPEGDHMLRRHAVPRGRAPRGKTWCDDRFV